VSAEIRSELSRGLEEPLAALRRLDDRKRLGELAVFGSLWAAGTALILAGPALATPLLQVPGTLLAALALNAFVLLLHEGMHGILLKDRRLNRWLSVALGATVLMSFTAYQVLHLRHHRYLGDPRDPDDYHNYSSDPAVVWRLHFVRLFLGTFLYLVLIPVLALRYGTGPERRRILTEYLLLAGLYTALAALVPGRLLAACWLAPLLLVAFAVNLRGLTQHTLTEAGDPYLASRSIHAHPVVAFLLLHENLHLEHHLFPEVPSYHLPELHRLLWRRLPRAVVNDSYGQFLARFLQAAARGDTSPIGLTCPAERKGMP
jgi:fatty acid desaturase